MIFLKLNVTFYQTADFFKKLDILWVKSY
jgi:hypothetical protein